jgi:hypothetical protein
MPDAPKGVGRFLAVVVLSIIGLRITAINASTSPFGISVYRTYTLASSVRLTIGPRNLYAAAFANASL